MRISDWSSDVCSSDLVRYAGWCCGYSPAGNGTGSDRASTTAVLHSGRNAARGAGRTGIATRHHGDVLAGTGDWQDLARPVRPLQRDRGIAPPAVRLGAGSPGRRRFDVPAKADVRAEHGTPDPANPDDQRVGKQ